MISEQFLIKRLKSAIPIDIVNELFRSLEESTSFPLDIEGIVYDKLLISGTSKSDQLFFYAQSKDAKHKLILLAYTMESSGPCLISQLSPEEFTTLIFSKLPLTSAAYLYLEAYRFQSEFPDANTVSSPIIAPLPQGAAELEDSIILDSPDLKSILQQYQGLCYLHHPFDEFSWKYVFEEIDKLEIGQVDFLYVDLPAVMFSPLLLLFNQNGNNTFLNKRLVTSELRDCYLQLAELCYKKNIQILPVGPVSEINYSELLITGFDRRVMNSIVINNIKKNQQAHPETKFLALFSLIYNQVANQLRQASVAIVPNNQSTSVAGTDLIRFHDFICKTCEMSASQASMIIRQKQPTMVNSLLYKLGLFEPPATPAASSIQIVDSGSCQIL